MIYILNSYQINIHALVLISLSSNTTNFFVGGSESKNSVKLNTWFLWGTSLANKNVNSELRINIYKITSFLIFI